MKISVTMDDIAEAISVRGREDPPPAGKFDPIAIAVIRQAGADDATAGLRTLIVFRGRESETYSMPPEAAAWLNNWDGYGVVEPIEFEVEKKP